MRWVVGDVQGCVRELEDLLTEISFDDGRDELWLAGDIINRGPESLATLRLWRSVGGCSVIGNHEVYALCARSGRWPRKPDRLQAVYDAADADELLDQLRVLPVLAHLPPTDGGREAWVVHGGVRPGWTDLHAVAQRLDANPHDDAWLVSDDVSFATRVRCCTPDGERIKWDGAPTGCPAGSRPWDELYAGATLIVHGHWARRGHYRGPRTIGLDSACVYGGKLTAWCQQDDTIVQVPCRRANGY